MRWSPDGRGVAGKPIKLGAECRPARVFDGEQDKKSILSHREHSGSEKISNLIALP
jgi:hypothetical protein